MTTTNRSALMLLVLLGLTASSCKVLARKLIAYRDAWANGVTKREGEIDNGIQTGNWSFYYESGQRRAKGRYENDHQVGPWTYYFENGVVEWTGAFDNEGKRTGAWEFHYPDETLRARGTYVGDFEDGPWEFFAQDGSLERAGQFDGGKLSGPWHYNYAGGKPKADGLCHRGQRIGPWRIWDAQGKESEQDFGSKPGVEIVRETWPNGEPRRVGVLQDGAAVGRWTSWHENGKQRFCCSLRDGRAAGVFEARDADGKLLARGVFDRGQFAAGSIAVQNGQEREIVPGPVPLAPPAGASWTDAEVLAGMSPEAAVGVLIAEANLTAEPTAVVARVATPTPPSAPVAAVVEQIAQEPDRVPAPMQPDLTVTQREELDGYVLNYLDGPSKKRLSRKTYAPSPNSPVANLGAERRRGDLEGKQLPFTLLHGVDGEDLDLMQYRGKKSLLIVVLRGFVGEVCIYCVAQTEALARCQERLTELGIEVLVVYPGPKENEVAFEEAYKQTFGKEKPPYRIFYDDPAAENRDGIVQKLGIAGDLAYPTTLIVDEQGKITYAYTGAHRADRPAAKALIKLIEGMKQ